MIYRRHDDVSIDTVNYGFFSRSGGVSSGLYESLNISSGSMDDATNVQRNREIIARQISCSNDHCKLRSVKQRHTNRVVHINGEHDNNVEADGMLSTDKFNILLVSTADCIPWLIIDEKKPLIGAIHVGWRGLASGIVENTVSMAEDLGSQTSRIISVIGPCIRQSSYEVGAEYYEMFLKQDTSSDQYFVKKNDSYFFDLPGFFKEILIRSGIRSNNIYDMHIDTFSDSAFFSCRRSVKNHDGKYGCNGSAIVML